MFIRIVDTGHNICAEFGKHATPVWLSKLLSTSTQVMMGESECRNLCRHFLNIKNPDNADIHSAEALETGWRLIRERKAALNIKLDTQTI